MELQFHTTEADFVSANWAYIKRHWWRFLFNYRLPIGIAASAVAVILFHPETFQAATSIFVVGIGLIAYILLMYRWTWHRQFQRFGQRLISATVDGQSLRMRAENREVVGRWSEFTDIYESNRAFLFAWRKRGIMLIPKGAMSQPQIEELRGLISANAKGKVKLASAVTQLNHSGLRPKSD